MTKKQVSSAFFALLMLGVLISFSGCVQKTEKNISTLISEDQAAFDKAVEAGIEKYIQKQQQDQVKAQEEQMKKQEEGMKNVPLVAEGEHILGDKNAAFTMYVYSDYHCPYCQRFHPTMHALKDANNDLNVVFRPLPMAHADTSTPLHEIAECIAEIDGNDAFWKFTDAVFANKDLSAENYKDSLKTLKIEKVSEIDACYTSGKYKDAIQKSVQAGIQLGLQGTPGSILRNNATGEVKFAPGAFPQPEIQNMLDALKNVKNPETTPTPSETPAAQ